MRGVLVDWIYVYGFFSVLCAGATFFVTKTVVPELKKLNMALAACFMLLSASFCGVVYWSGGRLDHSKILLNSKDLLSISPDAEQSLAISSADVKSHVLTYTLSLPEEINEIDLTAKPTYQFVDLECEDPKDCYQASFAAKATTHLGEKLTMNLTCDDSLISCLDAIESNSESISSIMGSAVAQDMKVISVKIK